MPCLYTVQHNQNSPRVFDGSERKILMTEKDIKQFNLMIESEKDRIRTQLLKRIREANLKDESDPTAAAVRIIREVLG